MLKNSLKHYNNKYKNNMWIVYTIMAVVVIVISVIWVKGITDMHEKYPDYKGDDLSSDGFNFDDEKEENKITNDSKRTNKKVY